MTDTPIFFRLLESSQQGGQIMMRWISVLLALSLYCLVQPANALRCGNDLVSEQNRKIEVLKKCGEPDFVETWQNQQYLSNSHNHFTLTHSTTAHVEEWTYNFGPTRFIQYLTFINDRLQHVENGAKGFNTEVVSIIKARCRSLLAIGDRKIEAYRKCGEPTTKSSHQAQRIVSAQHRYRQNSASIESKIHHDKTLQIEVNVEDWTYNFGPQYFMFFVTFENGKIVNIESGEHGF